MRFVSHPNFVVEVGFGALLRRQCNLVGGNHRATALHKSVARFAWFPVRGSIRGKDYSMVGGSMAVSLCHAAQWLATAKLA